MQTKKLLPLTALLLAAVTAVAQAAPPAAPAAPGTRVAAPGRGGRGFGIAVMGPAAPVPPEVAIPRPTAEEVQQINNEVKRLIASDSSPAKALLEKYQSLLAVTPPRANITATYTQTPQRQGPRHEQFVERAKKGNIDLLLEGDSITDWWTQNPEKKAVFEKYFGQYGDKVANFAIAGDTTQGNLWGLKNGEGQGFSPKAIMLMIGTNSMGGSSPAEIAEGIGAEVLELRKDFPNAKILLLAIFPRGTPNDPNRAKIAECNQIISKLNDNQHVFYMDIGKVFLQPNGAFIDGAFQGDNLHPTAKGYELWGEAVKDKIAELMK